MTEFEAKPKIRIVVADDHPIVCMGISNHLASQSDIEVLGQAFDGDQALSLAYQLMPDVIVLDINMPGLSVVNVLQRLQSFAAPPKVLILTADDGIENVVALLKAGAKGYVLKDEEPSAIVLAVRAIVQGKTWFSREIMDGVLNHIVDDTIHSISPDLTVRELEVLRMVAQGYHNQEIGAALSISERTVRYHLRNIYDKLGVTRRSEMVAWAVRNNVGEAQL